MEILFVSNLSRQAGMMETTRKQLALTDDFPAGRSIMADPRTVWNESWQKQLSNATVVLISWMGSSSESKWLQHTMNYLRQTGKPHLLMGSGVDQSDTGSGFSATDIDTVNRYLLYSGQNNFRNLWRWLANRFCGHAEKLGEPRELPWCGIIHPHSHQRIGSLSEYARQGWLQQGRLTVGLLIPRDEWIWGDLNHQNMLIKTLMDRGMNVIPVFSHWAADPLQQSTGVDTAVETYFRDESGWLIDVLINTLKFSLTVGRPIDISFFKRLDRPILQAYTLLQGEPDWRENLEGITPLDLSFSVSLPEFDGVIHSVPFASKEDRGGGDIHHPPIAERMDLLARKAEKWARLRHKPNAEKKVAIIFHNYPPSNASIGNAAGLDSPASVLALLRRMQQAGYNVGTLPADSQSLMNSLIACGTNDREFLDEKAADAVTSRLSAADYRNWFDQLPAKPAAQLANDWGTPPGNVFVHRDALLAPGMLLGNIFVGVQPPRGFGEDPAKIYHSPDCAPTHHYLAYYEWLRNQFGADAVMHIGTHGSLEWLPGKATGMSGECYPELALGDLPNIYPYLITIVGEGMQAKRRGAACLIGHQTPPMSHAGVYDELAVVERLVDEYWHYRLNQPEKLPETAQQILAAAQAANLTDAVKPPEADADFADYLEKLHACVNDLKNMQIRVGLHILGEAPAGDALVEYLLAMTRLQNGDIPSLFASVAAIKGYGADDDSVLGEVREVCRDLVQRLLASDFELDSIWPILQTELAWLQNVAAEKLAALYQVLQYLCGPLQRNLALTAQEMDNSLAALDGRFVEPGPAGAPTSGMADILPTGRNFYGVDPRMLPSPVAWECGKQLGDLLIERFVAEEGHYPESIGVILWNGANMRSRGQCIAQFLYFLGIRPVWQKSSGRVTGLEVIPLAELRRPRIDVTARISGLFRDAMPFAVQWMDRAVALAAAQDEPFEQNFVRKHIETEAAELTQTGLGDKEARAQAGYRIFGCPPGSYGAGVGALLEAKNWESVDDLGKVYVRWGAYAYGAKAKGEFLPERFSQRLATLEVTVKNEDNREVNLLHSDDFNAYHGGMVAAVRSLRGSAPRSYCGDSSDRGRVVVRSLQEEFTRVFRGEALNPKYIAGMQKHGYKGAADLAAVAAHCYDWDATSLVMENWMYESLAAKYALDPALQQWMQQVNPWALRRIAEKLLEAQQRGMWQARPETLAELRTLYLSIEGELEERAELGEET
jgi:cobaltochelatase CobN